MNLRKLLIFLLLVPGLMGSDCEETRLEGLDNGLMQTEAGELHPLVLPWTVTGSDNIEHQESFHSAISKANEWFGEEVFTGEIDQDRFEELELMDDGTRIGTIIVYEGMVGSPIWDDGMDFVDAGGIADLAWDEDGGIVFVDIVINVDYAYNADTVEDVLLHEFGHALGLGHDEDSIDLNSCMSSPPPYDCEYTQRDIDRVIFP